MDAHFYDSNTQSSGFAVRVAFLLGVRNEQKQKACGRDRGGGGAVGEQVPSVTVRQVSITL